MSIVIFFPPPAYKALSFFQIKYCWRWSQKSGVQTFHKFSAISDIWVLSFFSPYNFFTLISQQSKQELMLQRKVNAVFCLEVVNFCWKLAVKYQTFSNTRKWQRKTSHVFLKMGLNWKTTTLKQPVRSMKVANESSMSHLT